MFYTTNEIITSVKARTLAPTGQATYSDSDFIRFANEELLIKMVPDIMTIREDFFLRTKNYNVTNNKTNYTLPERTIANTLKDVVYIDPSNNIFPMARINLEDIPLNNFTSIYPSNFYVKGDQIVVAPAPNSTSGTIQMWYYERPSQLVLTSACGQITAINADTPIAGQTTYTVNADVSSYTSMDVVSGKSPFQDLFIDIEPVSSTSTTVVFTTSDVTSQASDNSPSVGDWICNEQTSPIPMVPQEFHPLLCEMVAARVIQGLGHNEKLEAINANLAIMKQNLMNMIANRMEQKDEKIVNRYSISRSVGYGWALGWNR